MPSTKKQSTTRSIWFYVQFQLRTIKTASILRVSHLLFDMFTSSKQKLVMGANPVNSCWTTRFFNFFGNAAGCNGHIFTRYYYFFYINDKFSFTDKPLCDLPHGTCYYYKDPCPDNMPVDCSEEFYCTLETNKCCCNEPPPTGKHRVTYW